MWSRKEEGCRVSLRDPVAKMELWLLDSLSGHRLAVGGAGGMPVRNSHAHPQLHPAAFGILLSLAWVPRDSKRLSRNGLFRTAGGVGVAD